MVALQKTPIINNNDNIFTTCVEVVNIDAIP